MTAIRPLTAWALALTLASPAALAQLEPQPTNFEEEAKKKKTEAPRAPQLTKPPELLEGMDAIYPPAAKERGSEGEVILRIDISAEGDVSKVAVMQTAGDPALDFAAMGAVTNFLFSPAEFDNKPAPVAIEYRQVFKIDVVIEQVPTEDALEAEADALEAALAAAENDPAMATTVGGDTGPLNFTGVVREAGNKVELEGVEVSVEIELPLPDRPEGEELTDEERAELLADIPLDIRTSYTDREGRFYFRGLPVGRHKVSYALSSYEAVFTFEEFLENERTEVVVYLDPEVANRFETVIREKRAKKEVAKITLTREEAKKIPGTFGDPLRVVENLPGLARAPFIGGALIVRGANPGDTGTYYDGVPIPILYHFGGLKSVVNAEFLEEISFYPGGFPAYYGRAIAGIVDVRSRDLNMQYFKGATDVSLIDTSFFFGGPISLGGPFPDVTIAAAARRSYLDALLPIAIDVFSGIGLIPEQSIVASPVYWDYQLKAETRPWSGHTLSLFAFGSQDDLKVVGSTGDAGINLGVLQSFHRLVGRWRWNMPLNVTHTFQPFVGIEATDVGISAQQGDTDVGLGLGFNTYNWGLRDELRWKPNDFIEMAVGIDYLGETFRFGIDIPEIDIEVGSYPRVFTRVGTENQSFGNLSIIHQPGMYFEGVFTPFRRLQLVPSIRFDTAYYTFSDSEELQGAIPPTPGSEPDEGKDDVGDNQAQLWNVSPRLTGRFTLFRGTTLKGGAGVFRQSPGGFNLSPRLGNPYLDSPRALQFIGGVEQRLTEYFNVDVQAYYIARDWLVQSTGELIASGDGQFTPVFNTNGGLGRTFGIELLLRHEIGQYQLRGLRKFVWPEALNKSVVDYDLAKGWVDDLADLFPPLLLILAPKRFLYKAFSEVSAFGWIAYTLSRSEVDTSERRESFRLTQFDQTHILTIVAQLNVPWGITLGSRFRLVTGNPTTLPVGSVHDLDTTNYNALQGVDQGTRLPTFHQLDIRIDRKLVFDNFTITPYLDLLNLYNQQNAEFYQTDYRSRERELIPSLPIFPNIGVQGEF